MVGRIVAGTTRVALGLLMVWLCKYLIDVTIHTGTTKDIILMAAVLVGIAVSSIMCRMLYYYLGVQAGIKQSTRIRLEIFSSLFQRRLFTRQNIHSADIASRLEKDIDMVSGISNEALPDLIVTLLQLCGAFLLMRSMDTRLAWLLLLMTPLLVVVGKLIGRKLRQMTRDIRQQESEIQMLVQETMELAPVLRAMESGGWMTGNLDDMQQGLRNKVRHRARYTVVSRLLIAITFSLGYICAFIWGAFQLRQGIITFGVMTSLLQLVNQIQQPILSMLGMLPQIMQATASIDRLEELRNLSPEASGSSVTAASMPANKTMGVLLQDITFRYARGDSKVMEHFSHDFRPGSKTALMGPTGTGKTTLLRLMLALINPDEGKLWIYQGNEREAVGEATRPHFVYVPQGNTLMSGTIRYNLQLARPSATEEEMHHVLHTAMADFVFDLPKGIDSDCGERGLGFSEGQAQRIAIARGLLRPGSIMLLDEISASLDAETEHELYRRLFAAYPEKTMIFITHRQAVCDLCDEVLSLV